jgi:hypothetical protein
MKPSSSSSRCGQVNPQLVPTDRSWRASGDRRDRQLAAVTGSGNDFTEDFSSSEVTSSRGDYEGHVGEKACPSGTCEGCAEVLHELANLMTCVVTNAQVLGWKLPPYSHLKRPIREVERNAQRGGELLKRLMQRCSERA